MVLVIKESSTAHKDLFVFAVEILFCRFPCVMWTYMDSNKDKNFVTIILRLDSLR